MHFNTNNQSHSLPPVHTSLFSILNTKGSFREKLECVWLNLCSHLSLSSRVRDTAHHRLETLVATLKLKEEIKKTDRDKKFSWDIQVIDLSKAKGLSEEIKREKQFPVHIKNTSTMQALDELKKAGISEEEIALLDLASEINPGGAYLLPSHGTQEEAMCVDSLLYDALKQAKINHNKKFPKEKNFIPKEGCLFIPNVPLIKGADTKMLKKTESIHVVAASALDFRQKEVRKKYVDKTEKVTINGSTIVKYSMNNEGKEATKTKMRAILEACKQNQKKHLILGALGCGAYQNSPADIANLWKEVIDEFGSDFESVTFAIYAKRDRDAPNLQAFVDTFPNN